MKTIDSNNQPPEQGTAGSHAVTGSEIPEEFFEIRVRKDLVPKGARLVEAYLTEREVIIMGCPPENEDEETGHNCDAMGCGSIGGHVLHRIPFPNDGTQP